MSARWLACIAAMAIGSGTSPGFARSLFSEDFSGAYTDPNGQPYGIGPIGGTKFSVIEGNVDIGGVVNGNFGVCPYDVNANCVDLIGDIHVPGLGAISSAANITLTKGQPYTVQFQVASENNYQYQVQLGDQMAIFTSTPTPITQHVTFIPEASTTAAALIFRALQNPDEIYGPVLSHIIVCATPLNAKDPKCVP